jgi:hypothetical protein
MSRGWRNLSAMVKARAILSNRLFNGADLATPSSVKRSAANSALIRSLKTEEHMIKKPRNYGKNLGAYLHKAKPKLADKTKIGQTKLKLSNKSKLGPATVVKPSRKKIRKMVTPKEGI